MSTDRETTRVVRSWLEEGVTALPDRVLDTVLDHVPATPQRRSWWPARRLPVMSRFAKFAVAAGVVVIATVAGAALLPRLINVGNSGPIPTPSLEPSPITLASPALHGPVAGGGYAFNVGSPGDGRYFPIELTLPAGWIPQKLNVDEVTFDGPDADGLFLGFYSVRRIYLNPCHPEAGYAGTYLGMSNTQDLISELRTFVGFEAGASSSVPIGDLQATHFRISNTIDTETAGCTDGALLPLFITWTADTSAELTARGDKSPATNGGTVQEVWIVDRGDYYPLLIIGEGGRTIQAGRATLDAIVGSITID